ncbi:zinc knuckle CX2CX4HX4C [Artemisia annua]|uniref:Zinc knuckle CX2CX4HX4C n=1 Tax=Artemisia annua TaxID=35608 RepID=A0A2U1LHF6_ARTAN|nr:zinc knuckle CX2CX4HX4C [Artemisia annua]
MDRMTTSICEKPFGRASFARVLVEIDSSKALVDNVELWYEKLGKVPRIRVEYTWVPPRCKECKVFGHYWSDCVKKVNTVSKVSKDVENVKDGGVTLSTSNGEINNGDGEEGWQTAGNRRNMRNVGYNTRQGSVGGYNGIRGIYNDRGGGNNRSNASVGGARIVQKKAEPVNNGSMGNVDESVVVNDKGDPAKKGSSKVNVGNANSASKSKSVNGDP